MVSFAACDAGMISHTPQTVCMLTAGSILDSSGTMPDVATADSDTPPASDTLTLASGFEDDTDALPIRADARVLGATLRAGESLTHSVGEGRYAYLVPAVGKVEIDSVFEVRSVRPQCWKNRLGNVGPMVAAK